jgi:hypothetical protein
MNGNELLKYLLSLDESERAAFQVMSLVNFHDIKEILESELPIETNVTNTEIATIAKNISRDFHFSPLFDKVNDMCLSIVNNNIKKFVNEKAAQ